MTDQSVLDHVDQAQTAGTSEQLEHEAAPDTATASKLDTIRRLQQSYEELSGPVRILRDDVEAGRRRVRKWDLDERTAAKARIGSLALLDELSADRGFSWSEIARLCGVSVSAVRKWRAGETPSPERRRELARLAAFVDLLDEIAAVADPASWLMMRLTDAHTVTAADLYLAGRADDLLEHAQGHLGLHEMLDRWDPNWRDEHRSEWMIVPAADNERSIVRRR